MSNENSLNNLVAVPVVTIYDFIKKLDQQINELNAQREHNASCGNWTVVKAIKDSVSRLQRDKQLLTKVLDLAIEFS